MSSVGGGGAGRKNEHSQNFLRQATILRKNMYELDKTIVGVRGADWPTMLGRLNAASNQSGNLDSGIDDVLEHLVYVPRKCTANAQDVPFFLSSRLAAAPAGGDPAADGDDAGAADARGLLTVGGDGKEAEDPVTFLYRYETGAAELAQKFEASISRF